MSRRCAVTSKAVMSGNNVSHANNRTRRRFLPNLQTASFYSESLKRLIRLRVTTAGIRTVEHKGGIDAYLMDTAPTKLPPELRKVRKALDAKGVKKVPQKAKVKSNTRAKATKPKAAKKPA